MEACFPCFGPRKIRVPPPPADAIPGNRHQRNVSDAARTFSFEERAAATRSFSDDSLVAGREPYVYRGHLKSANQVVAMKLQHHGSPEQHSSEFLARVLMLNKVRHPNLVNLIGFCADGSDRIFVHEYMPLGSLEDHLHDPSPNKARLDWRKRMNIAAGVARGLEYLHDKGVAYRCLSSSDILLGERDGYHYPKLSQYGLAKVGQLLEDPGETRDFTRITYGTVTPETLMFLKVSKASDVYSFGVILLETITGRRAFSPHAAEEDRILVRWARPLLGDRAKFRRMADPALQGRYPLMDFEEALAVASMCIQEDPAMRPPIRVVVTALARLTYDQAEEPHRHLSQERNDLVSS